MQTAFKCFQNHTLGFLLNPTAGFFLTKLTLKVHVWSKRFWSSYFSQVRTTTYAGIFSTWLVQLITFMAGIRSEVSSMPFLCRTLTSICIYIYGYESSCSQFSVTTAWQCTEMTEFAFKQWRITYITLSSTRIRYLAILESQHMKKQVSNKRTNL